MNAQSNKVRLEVGLAKYERDFLEIDGPEAEGFLQGQLSQDIPKIAVGASAWSFVLQPHGKIDALVRVTRLGGERFMLDVDKGFGDLVEARLRKFLLRAKLTISAQTWEIIAIRGFDTSAVSNVATAMSVQDGFEFQADAHWRGVASVDVIGKHLVFPPDCDVLGGEELESLRVASGMPAMGLELDEKTIPNEVGINDAAISFNKGCYTGQELVERIDTRGNKVPRVLVGLVFSGGEAPVRQSLLVNPRPDVREKPYGVITSVADSELFGATIGLGWLRRDASSITEAKIESVDGTVDEAVQVRVIALPMMENLVNG